MTCDYATYTRLLQEIAQLQRSNRLLEAKIADEAQIEATAELKDALKTELKISEAKVKDLEALIRGQSDAVDLTLVEEKRQLQHLNVGLSDRVADLQTREARARSMLQDAKDSSELLEFRVLELEEELDKLKKNKQPKENSDAVDSGCNTSTATEEDVREKYRDFRKEKVMETQNKLQTLLNETPGAGAKSLLLQTVALFETLLAKINVLQTENNSLRANDGAILDLEAARTKLAETEAELSHRKETLAKQEAEIATLKHESEKRKALEEHRDQKEVRLKDEVNSLKGKLDSSLVGRKSESEMYEEAILRANDMEKSVNEMNAQVSKANM